MRTIERGAVYDGYGNISGFRCYQCGRVFDSMLGDICNGCFGVNQRHRELIEALRERERLNE
jgi:hypothetical protein